MPILDVDAVPIDDHSGLPGWMKCPVCGRECYRMPCCTEQPRRNIVYKAGYLARYCPITDIGRYSMHELESYADEGLLPDGMRFVTLDGLHEYEAQPRERMYGMIVEFVQEIVEVEVTDGRDL